MSRAVVLAVGTGYRVETRIRSRMKCIRIGSEERRKVESGGGVGVGWEKKRGYR